MNDQDRAEIVTLRDHFTALLDAQDRRIDQAITSSKEAVDKAEKAQERRLDLLNEFRAQSKDESARFAQRDVVEPRVDKLEAQVARLYGGLVVVAFVGVANLVKLFLG